MQYRGFEFLKETSLKYWQGWGITKNRSGQFSLGLGGREKIDKNFTEKMCEYYSPNEKRIEGIRTPVCSR